MAWNTKGRSEDLKRASAQEFDLVIIGGGVTGAGVAREAALKGYSFIILDKNDFAFGTSSRSSKLAHGGLRYLSGGEFGLVRESVTERNWLRNHLPHNVRPLGFMYCIYENSKDKVRTIRMALRIYDWLSNIKSDFKNYRKAKFFSPEFVEEFEPCVTREEKELGKLKWAGFYYDTNIDDARLTLETIKEGLQINESSVALNYTKVESYIKDGGRVQGVKVRDELSGETFEVKGKAVIACGGIWSDEVMAGTDFDSKKIYPTKGVHIVVPNERVGNRNGFGIRSFDDGRFFFVLRRGKVTVIGTTDTDYYKESSNLDEPWCTKEDSDYLLRTVNRIFPHAQLTEDDIIGTYAGIRPLIKQEGAANESAVSREHEIFESKDGVVAMAGGKLTTYRLMAEELLNYLVDKSYIPGYSKPEYKKSGYTKQPFKVGMWRKDFDKEVTAKGLDQISWPDQLDYLHQQYGKQAITILENIKANPAKGEALLEGYEHCAAEIDFILENECAPKLVDVLCRRTEAQWMIWHHKQTELAAKVGEIMAGFYGWDEAKKQAEIDEYLAYVKKTIWF